MSEYEHTPRDEYVTASRAAKELGVSVEVIWGLVNNRQIDGTVTTSSKGNSVTMVKRAALTELLDRIRRGDNPT